MTRDTRKTTKLNMYDVHIYIYVYIYICDVVYSYLCHRSANKTCTRKQHDARRIRCVAFREIGEKRWLERHGIGEATKGGRAA